MNLLGALSGGPWAECDKCGVRSPIILGAEPPSCVCGGKFTRRVDLQKELAMMNEAYKHGYEYGRKPIK